MKYLITGASGFVGIHLTELLIREADAIVYTLSRHQSKTLEQLGVRKQFASSMDNQEELGSILKETRPDFIVHLASQSSVAKSWIDPAESFKNNTNIFLNLLEAVRKGTPTGPRILSVGSSDQYGSSGIHTCPLTEETPLHPLSPYAVARVAQEHLGQIYHKGYQLNLISTRSFNHLGRGQTDKFVVSSFVKQAVEIKLGHRKEFVCGNWDVVRDFVDVRDVARAYKELLFYGKTGEVYNICSGVGTSLKEVIQVIKNVVEVDFTERQDPQLYRPVETPLIVGSLEKIRRDIGFVQEFTLKDSIIELSRYWMGILDK